MTTPTSYRAGRGVLVGAGDRWVLAADLPEGLEVRLHALLSGRAGGVEQVLDLVGDSHGGALAVVDGDAQEPVVVARGGGEVRREGEVHRLSVGEPTGSPLPFAGGVVRGAARADVRLSRRPQPPPAAGGLIDGIPPEILASSAREPEPEASHATVVRPRPVRPERDPGHDGHTVHRPRPAVDHLQQATSETVSAVRCPAGHLTDPTGPACRVCGAHVPPQEPRRVTRPTLGTLRLPTGEAVALDRGVVLGRRPEPVPGGERWPHLVELPGDSTYLSRVHLEVRLDGWLVLGTDLGSRAGTTLRVPGRAPQRMRAHEAYPLEAGWALDLADVYEVRLEAVAR